MSRIRLRLSPGASEARRPPVRWLAATLARPILCAAAGPSAAQDRQKQSGTASIAKGGKRLALRCALGHWTLGMSLSGSATGMDLSAPLREVSTCGNRVLLIKMPDGSFSGCTGPGARVV